MEKIQTKFYKASHEIDPFSDEERSRSRRSKIKEKAVDISRAVGKPVGEGLKGMWQLLNYMGKGYAPFDIGNMLHDQFSDKSGTKNVSLLEEFKSILKKYENTKAEYIKEKFLRDLLSEDESIRKETFNEIKKQVEINDKELYDIIETWKKRRNRDGIT